MIFFSILFLYLSVSAVTSKEVTEGEESLDDRCNDDVLVNHLASCEILSPESIVNLPIKEIDSLCRKLDDTLKEIDKYLKTCIPPPTTNLFMSYIAGMKVLNTKMCAADSNFAKRFGPCYVCLHEMKTEFNACSGPADWTEDIDAKKICKTYKTITDCYYVKSAKVCGIEAAAVLKELVMDVIDNVLCVKCSGIKSNPYVKDAMPPQYLKRSGVSHQDYMEHIYIGIILNLLLIFLK